MYGSIFRMKVKAGRESELIEQWNDWDTNRRPVVDGAVASLLLKPDETSAEMIGIAVFRDRAAYRANAEAPEQDRWFRKLRETLDADPEWEDGEYVAGGVG